MLKRSKTRFRKDEEGAVLIETLIVIPILLIMAFGFFEFGNIFWQREQLQSGVRDAARYWSRCRQTSGNYNTSCSEAIARNIAFYATPTPTAGVTRFRVPGWDGNNTNFAEFEIGPTKANLPGTPTASDTVVVVGRADYQAWFFPFPVTLQYSSRMRYIGW